MEMNKFMRLKAKPEAAGLKRVFHWLTEGDAKKFDDDYKKTESFKIKEELKNELKR